MDLLPAAILMTFAAIVFVFGLVFLSYKFATGRRRKVFLKISKEYGLTLNSQYYPLNTIIIKDRPYVRFSVTGAVRGHTVLIEDIFTNMAADKSYGLIVVGDNLLWGGIYISLTIKRQTRVTIDGVSQIFDDTNFFRAVPHKSIKMLLGSLA